MLLHDIDASLNIIAKAPQKRGFGYIKPMIGDVRDAAARSLYHLLPISFRYFLTTAVYFPKSVIVYSSALKYSLSLFKIT